MTDKNIIRMTWDYGNAHAAIDITKFFPTSDRRIRKLFNKFVLVDDDHQHRKEVAETIVQYLTEQVQTYGNKEKLKAYANEYINARTSVAELERSVEKQKEVLKRLEDYKKGLKPAEKKVISERNQPVMLKLKNTQMKLKSAKEIARFAYSNFRSAEKDAELYTKNLKLVKEICHEMGWE